LIPLVSPKDLFHSPDPLKGSLIHIYRLPTKRHLGG
jgi:hypothetical protein